MWGANNLMPLTCLRIGRPRFAGWDPGWGFCMGGAAGWLTDCSIVRPGPWGGASTMKDFRRGSPKVWLLGQLLVQGACERSTVFGRGRGEGSYLTAAGLPTCLRLCAKSPPFWTWTCFFLCNHHHHFSRTYVSGTVLSTLHVWTLFLKEDLKPPLHRVIWRYIPQYVWKCQPSVKSKNNWETVLMRFSFSKKQKQKTYLNFVYKYILTHKQVNSSKNQQQQRLFKQHAIYTGSSCIVHLFILTLGAWPWQMFAQGFTIRACASFEAFSFVSGA